jgi:hypothetical protein
MKETSLHHVCEGCIDGKHPFEFEFWTKVMNITFYIKNQCPTKSIDSNTC